MEQQNGDTENDSYKYVNYVEHFASVIYLSLSIFTYCINVPYGIYLALIGVLASPFLTAKSKSPEFRNRASAARLVLTLLIGPLTIILIIMSVSSMLH